MKKWTLAALKKKGVFIPASNKPPVIKVSEAPEIGQIKWELRAMNISYVSEFEFVPDRKFRADLYVPSLNLLIEYEGMFAEGKNGTGKSRHLTVQGYTQDCEKYFLANVHGYKVLRLTALNYKKLLTYIKLLTHESESK